jgi:hypothetical protein
MSVVKTIIDAIERAFCSTAALHPWEDENLVLLQALPWHYDFCGEAAFATDRPSTAPTSWPSLSDL